MSFIFFVLLGAAFIVFIVYTVWTYLRVRQERTTAVNTMQERLQNIGKPKNVSVYAHPNESFVLDKAVIYLCTHDSDNQLYDLNTLMFVSCHELAHVLSPTYGHDENFYKTFYQLLNRAEKKGYWNPNKRLPNQYCNLALYN